MVNRLSMDPKTYETTRYTLNDGTYWPKTTDNFWQDHNILSAAWDISESDGHPDSNRYYQLGFVPMSGTTA